MKIIINSSSMVPIYEQIMDQDQITYYRRRSEAK